MKIKCYSFVLLLSMSSLLIFSCEEKIEIPIEEPEKEGILLTNLNLIDGVSDTIIDNCVIFIEDDKIQFVGDKDDVPISYEYEIIDLKGKYVMPGFINSHFHASFDDEKLQEWCSQGVTTVRDLSCGGKDYTTARQLADNFNRENKNARLVFTSPIITKVNGYGHFFINDVDEAEEAVNTMINNKADIIKIAVEDDLQQQTWIMLSPEEINKITETAHNRNYKVSVHVSRSHQVEMAVNGNVDDLAHMIIDNLGDDLVNQIIQKAIYWVPTLELWKGVSDLHPVNYIDQAISNLTKFYNAGGKIALGTDFMGYINEFDLGMPITEMELMKQAGMTEIDIIKSATKNSAFVCGLGDNLGTIETGKIADIIAVDINPLENIKVFTNVVNVILNG